MKLNSIFQVNEDEELKKKYASICEELKNKFGVDSLYDIRKHAIEDYKIENLYAHNVHTGKIKDGVDITELELSMICDGGFSHFGGRSAIYNDRSFRVDIYTD